MIKALINSDLDHTSQRPAVNPNVSRYYMKGDVVQVARAKYEDNQTLWYILENGIQVDAHFVEIEPYSGVGEADRTHFFLCYRKLDQNNNPSLDDEGAPEKLHFAQITTPSDTRRFMVNHWDEHTFVNAVMQSVRKLESERKHVFIYIHGFDWEPGLKLDLPASFVQSYMSHPANTIAKVIYFGWPSSGWRTKADDKAIQAGEHFTRKNFFNYFKLLSDALKEEGKSLNLIVHSFGHQLLNGMINPGDNHVPRIPQNIFEHVFLMAPDITHLAVQRDGVFLRNQKKTRRGKHFMYSLAPLKKLSANVHVYYNELDYLLYLSTQKFNGNKSDGKFDPKPDIEGITTDYRNLGNYGRALFDASDSGLVSEDGFNYFDVQDLVKTELEADPLYYPFRNLKDEHMIRTITNIREHSSYEGLALPDTFWNRHFLMTHHQYLFTCRPVVDHVLRLLNKSPKLAEEELIV
ncbi:alpha/beta hydrolase [Dyadobacter sp. CY345]|uniref:alpha/beta hydrolase n=1 Tax=Dyadobacter sp. CY345 TaxID=2909335 RepID=UPI001F2AC51B|nr:alpha/beta hydrolase [Dyadobacter sp. CY345]MCF2447700.1 alpha/beta hydrolase [Dyadobacter sp. CY345]